MRSRIAAPPRPPGAVYAAAVVTWVAATLTAALTATFAVGLLTLGGPVFSAFGPGAGNPRWWVAGAVVIVVGLSAAADLIAFRVVRGRGWARWTLIGLSVVAMVGGILSIPDHDSPQRNVRM